MSEMSEKQHRIEKRDKRESDLREAFQRYISAKDTEGSYSCMEILWREYGDRESVLRFRESVTHIDNPNELDLELYKASYDLCARDYFDDFMLALEWDRGVNEKFWLPRRKKLIHICEHLQALEDGELDELFLSMPPRTGKALADDTPILTRAGWKNHGDLEVGDEVIGLDGKFKKVIAVHPKCLVDRQIEFTNGEKVVCHENHEWMLIDRTNGKTKLRETKYWENRKLYIGKPGKRGHRYILQVPQKKYVEGEWKELPLDPYTFGAWLGDGTNRSPVITNGAGDVGIIRRIVENGSKLRWTTINRFTYVPSYSFDFRDKLKKMGMCHSRKRLPKYIPKEYLTASKEQRLELLAGLLDTDGTLVKKERRYHFCTCDVELKDSFLELIATFGWRCCVTIAEPKKSSSGVRGRKPTYVIGFNPDCYIPCELKRKQLHEYSKQRKVAVTRIKKVEPKQGNCITVEGDGVYLCGKSLIPTHNSTIVQFFALWTMLRHPELSSLYCTYTDTVAKVFYTGLLEILNDPYTYRWQQIFPERSLASTDAKDLLLNIDKKKRYASFTARSLWGSLNGAINASNYLIGDDLISGIEEAMSPDRLNTAWRTVQNNYLARNADGKAKILWIGTRWSLQDPIARRIDTLESDPEFASVRYEIVNTPALNGNDESNFEYAFGKGFTTQYFRQVRASFERNNDLPSWDAQFQGEPIERSGTVFAPDDLRYYNGVLPKDTEADRVFVVVDPAWGGGDRCAGIAIHQYDSDLYVDGVVFNNGDKKITQPMIAKMARDHKATAMFIEATKATSGYAEGVKRILDEDKYRLNMQTTTKHWSGQRGKQQRIFDRSPDIRENMIFRDASCRSGEYQKFMENIYEFKVLGKNKQGDDAPDVCAMAIVFAFVGEAKAVIMKRPY